MLWNNGADAQTPAAGLSYLVRVGTVSAGSQLLRVPRPYSLDGLGGGSFLYSTRVGAAAVQRGLKLNVTKGSTVYWSVTSVDSGGQRSGPMIAERRHPDQQRRNHKRHRQQAR